MYFGEFYPVLGWKLTPFEYCLSKVINQDKPFSAKDVEEGINTYSMEIRESNLEENPHLETISPYLAVADKLQIYLAWAYWHFFYSGKQAILSLSTHVHFHPPPHMSKYSNI